MSEAISEVVSKAKAAADTPRALVESLTGMSTRLEAMDTVLGVVAQDLGKVTHGLGHMTVDTCGK